MKRNILIIILSVILVVCLVLGGLYIYKNYGDNKNPKKENENALDLLNELVEKGYLKESNLAFKSDYENYAFINNNGKLIIKNLDKENNSLDGRIADEIEGKVSKVALVVRGGVLTGFVVITEDGKLYSQNKTQLGSMAFDRKFEKIALPSKVKKIYTGGIYPVGYYVLLENNDVYELVWGNNTSTDLVLGDKLTKKIAISSISVLGTACSSVCYPELLFTYNGKTYLNNNDYKNMVEIKDENNKSISAKYAISELVIKETYEDSYSNAYIVSKDGTIYLIPKISERTSSGSKINTKVSKYSSKKVKNVNGEQDNKVVITYEDNTTETINGYSVTIK